MAGPANIVAGIFLSLAKLRKIGKVFNKVW
jgi:hypothetical protein